jgi:hypothetical protein
MNATTCDASEAGWVYTILNNHVGCDSIVAVFYTLQIQLSLSCMIRRVQNRTRVFLFQFAKQYGCDSTVTLHVSLWDYNECHLEYSFAVDTPLCEGDEVWMHIDLWAGEGRYY